MSRSTFDVFGRGTETACFNFFSIAVVEYSDQRQLREDRVCFSLRFQRERVYHGGKRMAIDMENMAAGTGS